MEQEELRNLELHSPALRSLELRIQGLELHILGLEPHILGLELRKPAAAAGWELPYLFPASSLSAPVFCWILGCPAQVYLN